ncbi:MAG: carotenoid biosynthesis protein [Blastocatellales bacterium]
MKLPDWKKYSLPVVVLVTAYSVMWAGGIGHYILVGKPPMDAPWAASLFLFLAGLIVAVTSARKDLAGLLLAAFLGLVAEIVGVHFGFIFSRYSYTSVLQPQLFGVPLVMLSAWMVLIAYVRQMLSTLNLSLWLEATLAASWMTAIDLVIDPLAANQLGYWRWEKAGAYYGIPFHNFVGWFVVSLIIFGVVHWRGRENVFARYVGLSIVIFFSAIALSYGLVVAAVIGLFLCLIHLALARPVKSGSFLQTGQDSKT